MRGNTLLHFNSISNINNMRLITDTNLTCLQIQTHCFQRGKLPFQISKINKQTNKHIFWRCKYLQLVNYTYIHTDTRYSIHTKICEFKFNTHNQIYIILSKLMRLTN